MEPNEVMNSATLHSAARRYLANRYEELTDHYSKLPDRGLRGYSPAAVDLFSRYNVISAILVQIQRLDPDHLPDLESLLSTLLRDGGAAHSTFTDPPFNAAGARSAAEERHRFAEFLHGWLAAPIAVPPLPYRRVLREEEAAAHLILLQQRWDVRGQIWHPMLDTPIPEGVLVLDESAMWTPAAQGAIRQALNGLGRSRILEIREAEPHYQVDIADAEFTYTGDEGLWSDEHLDWISYASHEGTVAFGGRLAELLPGVWPELSTHLWRGW